LLLQKRGKGINVGRDLKASVQKYQDYVIALRRYFHTWPERSTQEFNTQSKIIAELTDIGLEARKAATTGVIADIQGGRPGKTIAIRADIDGLPIQDECGQPYQSQNPGVCHACGHDGHTAMLLGVARILWEMRGELEGNVRLIFQPSEELFPGGASPLIEAGVLTGVDAIIGAHLWQPIETGQVGISYGRMMAQAGGFAVTIKGKGGHVSMPHKTTDPILAGTQIVHAIDSMVGHNVDPVEPAMVLVTIFKAGQVRNIIPDTAYIEGAIRVFDSAMLSSIHERIEQIVKGICLANGADYTFTGTTSSPPVINDPAIVRFIKMAAVEVLGEAAVSEIKPVLAGEDFSYYQRKVPGAFVFIGAGNQQNGVVYSHHHPKFDIDEGALSYGVEIMIRSIFHYLRTSG
jgi:amidohydrolase